MSREQVDAHARSLGYHHIGGMTTNRVYLHPERCEVLKVALTTDVVALEYARASLRRALDISAVYADQDLMPRVFEVGDDYQGTGYPWLREQYIAGDNLGGAYLADPAFWTVQAPSELVRIVKRMAATHAEDVTATWRDKLAGMTCPPGYEDIYTQVHAAGTYLAQRYTTGHIIHGDLQFGNILAQRRGQAARCYLIDWEVSEVMPLGYEFAMLYTFLLGPEDQVEPQYQQQYAERKPLRTFWAALAPRLVTDLGISEDEFKHSVSFRMGNGWLYQLDQALERGDGLRARQLAADLRSLLSGQCFDILPYP